MHPATNSNDMRTTSPTSTTCADTCGISTTVEKARWDDDAKVWRVALAGGETLSALFLITATGFLSQPHTPDIPGIATFEGRIIHTTAWDDNYDFEGRRIGLIGTGATAVQLLPELAKKAADLTVYQRTPIHVVPKIDFPIPEVMQRLFARLPLIQRVVRWVTDIFLDLLMVLCRTEFPLFPARLNLAAAELSKALRFVSIRDEELRRKLTPDYDFGCKRPTYSNSYYRTFTKPHVHLQTSGIERIESDGIIASDGTKTQIDTLVLATGFDQWHANLPAIEIIGRDGRNLGKWWREQRVPRLPRGVGPAFPELSEHGQPLCQLRLVVLRARSNTRCGTWTGYSVSCAVATQPPLRHRRGQRPLSRSDDQSVGQDGARRGDCARARSYYFGPNGETLFRLTSSQDATMREQASFPLSDYAIA